MATALQGFRLTVRSCSCRAATHQHIYSLIGAKRALSITSSRLQDRHSEILQKVQSSNAPIAQSILRAEEKLANMGKQIEEFMEDEWDEMEERIEEKYPPFQLPAEKKKKRDTFLNMGEDEPWESDDIMEDDQDDITTLGHGELERHREMRHYARLIAWEMPLLSSTSIIHR
jgi:small subunit ribosomal protein S35